MWAAAAGDGESMGRDALHSQLAAAVQVVLHVRRNDSGRRELAQIAVLSIDSGRCEVIPAWTVSEGNGPGRMRLDALLDGNGGQA